MGLRADLGDLVNGVFFKSSSAFFDATFTGTYRRLGKKHTDPVGAIGSEKIQIPDFRLFLWGATDVERQRFQEIDFNFTAIISAPLLSVGGVRLKPLYEDKIDVTASEGAGADTTYLGTYQVVDAVGDPVEAHWQLLLNKLVVRASQ